jgi:hypothetical protein
MLESTDAGMWKAAIAVFILGTVAFLSMAILTRRGYMPDIKLSRRAKLLLAVLFVFLFLFPILQVYLMRR